MLIISQVEADFCSMIQAAGSRECKRRGCFPGKWGLFLLKRAGLEGKVWPGHDPSPYHPLDNAKSQDKTPAAQGIPAPGCNVPEQSQACDPTLTHSSLRAAGHQLLSIQNSRKVIMSNGEEMEITTPCPSRGVTGRDSGKSLRALFSNWVVLWASMP